jgi:quinol monooxygenase YgiN
MIGLRYADRRVDVTSEARGYVAYFVAIYHEVWPRKLDELLGTIRSSLASSPALHPGRRTTRLFQRFGRPTQLLSVGEWTDEHAFEQFRQWPVFVQSNAVSGPPPRIEPLVPLRRFERMEQRVALASCVTVNAPPPNADAVRDFLVRDAHQSVKSVTGLVSREVFQARDTPGRFLVVRSWRSLADLERFRATGVLDLDETHRQLGATVERFTGTLAAEFSVLNG